MENKFEPKEEIPEVNIALVGIGPYCKKSYMKFFKVEGIVPKLIIELEEKRDIVNKILQKAGFKSETYFLENNKRDRKIISEADTKKLEKILKKLKITHGIVCTEPKAHFGYIKLFLENNIHVLTEKPLTVHENVTTDINEARKVIEDYNEIKNLYIRANQKQKTIFQIQCQRRFNKAYQYIHSLAEDIVLRYKIPITSIELSHGDGNWNMPDEYLSKENHPYKYGYGKLFHSGYHFIDLINWFESINDKLINKNLDSAELYVASVRPSDHVTMINQNDYQNLIMNNNRFGDIIDKNKENFKRFGEIDLHSIIQFKHEENVISTVTLNLMQNTFSRRSWINLPEDTYKGNGRVRNEHMNLEIGPLMNIQVHAYQSKEEKDKIDDSFDVGEIENFDIYIFRNIDLIGGEPFQKISIDEIYRNDVNFNILGYMNESRRNCFKKFINCEVSNEPIFEQEFTINLEEKICESMSNKYQGKSPVIKFNLK